MKSILLVGLIILAGCSATVPVHKIDETKDTGWVKVVKSNYLFHKTLEFPDGYQTEFYHCEVVGALDEEGTYRIHYKGDGSTMHDCAKNVTVESKPGTRNENGKKIDIGTKQIKGDPDGHETVWLTADNTSCGHVRTDYSTRMWVAFAFEDMSTEHFFKTEAEARKWLTDNWCRS